MLACCQRNVVEFYSPATMAIQRRRLSRATATTIHAISCIVKPQCSSMAAANISFCGRNGRGLSVRFLSTADVFDRSVGAQQCVVPEPPAFQPGVDDLTLPDLVEIGESVLTELGVWSPLTPASYVRWLLESLHHQLDIPWWQTLILGACLLRIALYGLHQLRFLMLEKEPTSHEKYQQFVNKKIEEQKLRSNDEFTMVKESFAKKIMRYKNPDFFNSSVPSVTKMNNFILIAGTANAVTNYFAVKGLASANYPGFAAEGLAPFFTDLTAMDPYHVVQAATPALIYIAAKWPSYRLLFKGLKESPTTLEFSADQFTYMKHVFRLFQFSVPALIFFAGTHVPGAVCLWWAASNATLAAHNLCFGRFLPSGKRDLFTADLGSEGVGEGNNLVTTAINLNEHEELAKRERKRLERVATPWQLRKD